MLVSRLFIIFIIYSILGWIYESAFTTIKENRWQNRGFLYGPICPIYGIGALAISIIAEQTGFGSDRHSYFQLFLIAFFGSGILEYVTSWIFEQLFHAVWWDYSNLPFNIQGRTSFFTSVGFGIAGIFVVNVLVPVVEKAADTIPDNIMTFAALVFMGILGADIALTATALVGFAEIVSLAEESFNDRMELFVRKIHRPALLRVRFFKVHGIDRNRLDRIRKELTVRIQESGSSIIRRKKNKNE